MSKVFGWCISGHPTVNMSHLQQQTSNSALDTNLIFDLVLEAFLKCDLDWPKDHRSCLTLMSTCRNAFKTVQRAAVFRIEECLYRLSRVEEPGTSISPAERSDYRLSGCMAQELQFRRQWQPVVRRQLEDWLVYKELKRWELILERGYLLIQAELPAELLRRLLKASERAARVEI